MESKPKLLKIKMAKIKFGYRDERGELLMQAGPLWKARVSTLSTLTFRRSGKTEIRKVIGFADGHDCTYPVVAGDIPVAPKDIVRVSYA